MLLVDIGMFILFILMLGCVEPVIHLCLLGPCFICNEILDDHVIVHVLKPRIKILVITDISVLRFYRYIGYIGYIDEYFGKKYW